jgi:hypothetical protein
VLEEFLERPKVAERLAPDWNVLAIDTDRMTHGKAVLERIKGARSGGLPWLVMLDGDGKERISGVGPKGNIGAPVEPHECEHFLAMLRATKQRATDDDLAVIGAELELHAKPKRRR